MEISDIGVIGEKADAGATGRELFYGMASDLCG